MEGLKKIFMWKVGVGGTERADELAGVLPALGVEADGVSAGRGVAGARVGVGGHALIIGNLVYDWTEAMGINILDLHYAILWWIFILS